MNPFSCIGHFVGMCLFAVNKKCCYLMVFDPLLTRHKVFTLDLQCLWSNETCIGLIWFCRFFNRVRMESFVLGAMIHHHSMALTGWLQTTGFVTFAPDPWDSRRGGLGPLGYLATFKTYMDHQVNLRFFCTETTETHPILKGNIEVLLVSSA